MNTLEKDCLKLYIGNFINNQYPDAVVLFLAGMMSEANKNELAGGQLLFLNQQTKKQLCEKLGVCMKTLDNTLARCIDADIIRRVVRGVYQFNPNLIGKGQWEHIVVTQECYKSATGANKNGTKHTE